MWVDMQESGEEWEEGKGEGILTWRVESGLTYIHTQTSTDT
jgi:hypothetical protein